MQGFGFLLALAVLMVIGLVVWGMNAERANGESVLPDKPLDFKRSMGKPSPHSPTYWDDAPISDPVRYPKVIDCGESKC